MFTPRHCLWAQKDSLSGILGVDEFVHIRKCLQEWIVSLHLCYVLRSIVFP